jgi:peroxiredoxin
MEASGGTSGSVRDSTIRVEVGSAGRYAITSGILLLLASVSLNVVLARRVWFFTHLQSNRAAERLLKVGTTVPPIAAKRVDGQLGVISYEGAERSTVLYIFTPPCSWCARNVDSFKTLADKQSAHYRFIGISLSEQGLPEYVAKNDLKLPVYSGLSPETLKTYKLGTTPQTIVISPEGKVLQDWVGAYMGNQKSQLEAFFNVSLPSLRADTQPAGR